MKKRVHVIVSGRVQGVAFRHYARRTALELGLTGWVRNLDDGKVELLCEGESASIDAMIHWCRQGPPAAVVSDLEVKEEPYIGNLRGFDITF